MIKFYLYSLFLFASVSGANELADGCLRVYSGGLLCIESEIKSGTQSPNKVIKYGGHQLVFVDKYRISKLITIDYPGNIYGINIYQGRDSESLLVLKINNADALIEIIRSEPFRGRVFDSNQEAPYFSDWSFETRFESKCPDGVIAVTKIFFDSELASRWRRCLRSSTDNLVRWVIWGFRGF